MVVVEAFGFGCWWWVLLNAQHLTSISDEDSDKFRFHSVSEEDVSKIIKYLPSNKAPGYDKVTARVLKDSSPVTVPIITDLINGSFSHNTFPNA